MRLLWEWWIQVWPNLAASVVTLPVAFIWHHRRIKHHINKTIEAVKSSDSSA